MKVSDFHKSKADSVISRMRAAGRPFHCADRVLSVVDNVTLIAQKCGLYDPEIELLRLAALYSDIGVEVSGKDHQANSCRLFAVDAIGSLSVGEIECVSALIMSTRMPQDPRTEMQKVAADAYVSYVVLDDYWKWTELRRVEEGKREGWSWWDEQSRFLYTHRFHTEFMRNKRAEVEAIRSEVGKKQMGG